MLLIRFWVRVRSRFRVMARVSVMLIAIASGSHKARVSIWTRFTVRLRTRATE